MGSLGKLFITLLPVSMLSSTPVQLFSLERPARNWVSTPIQYLFA